LGQYSCALPQGWSGSVTPSLSGHTFTPAMRSFSNVSANQSAQNFAAAVNTDVVWVDDAVPTGAVVTGSAEGWTWIGANPTPISGGLAHQSGLLGGVHQHYFYDAANVLTVGVGEVLFSYVYLDAANPPSQVMLQWNDGSWQHRAYWGANQIDWGIDGTAIIVGCALLEVIRNGLVLAQVSSYWQQTLVGVIIILAVLVDRIRSRMI